MSGGGEAHLRIWAVASTVGNGFLLPHFPHYSRASANVFGRRTVIPEDKFLSLASLGPATHRPTDGVFGHQCRCPLSLSSPSGSPALYVEGTRLGLASHTVIFMEESLTTPQARVNHIDDVKNIIFDTSISHSEFFFPMG